MLVVLSYVYHAITLERNGGLIVRCRCLEPPVDRDLRPLARRTPQARTTVRPFMVPYRSQCSHGSTFHVLYKGIVTAHLLARYCHYAAGIPPCQACSTSIPRRHTTPHHGRNTTQTAAGNLLQLLRKRKNIDEKKLQPRITAVASPRGEGVEPSLLGVRAPYLECARPQGSKKKQM